jgi:hypothetical protein
MMVFWMVHWVLKRDLQFCFYRFSLSVKLMDERKKTGRKEEKEIEGGDGRKRGREGRREWRKMEKEGKGEIPESQQHDEHPKVLIFFL